MKPSNAYQYETNGGVKVDYSCFKKPYINAAKPLLKELDTRRGILLTSSYEYPGRYTRWDIGFVNPPLELSAQRNKLSLTALNKRGEILLAIIGKHLIAMDILACQKNTKTQLDLEILRTNTEFSEEQRSRQPSVFSVLREIINLFYFKDDAHLGLYGAFGYDLAFQFEPTRLKMHRDTGQRDLVLYFPDEILFVDNQKQSASLHRYEFTSEVGSSHGLPRNGVNHCYTPAQPTAAQNKTVDGISSDHCPGEYQDTVRQAISHFEKGALFEVVPGQTFSTPSKALPSELFQCLKERNPAPYGALINLGKSEYLVAASPEMYVRVQGQQVETCPIAGTIKRGATAMEDAQNILELLNSEKETSELTMCTDVDRNDKSRICEAGSIQVVGRRQIEMYSRLIHTVDHVKGQLREGYDALDAFMAHTWAVTVTGAPKQHAIQFLEDHERSPRLWYGGALGVLNFNGDMNTGLTLRTIRLNKGMAEVRAGATLLHGSDPDAEEQETHLKASALLDAIRNPDTTGHKSGATHHPQMTDTRTPGPHTNKRVLIIDHEDSFVHTLAGYFRETGAEVLTFRNTHALTRIKALKPNLIVLSPGPGKPYDFNIHATISLAIDLRIPLFGVCLGLQGICEFYGCQLRQLDLPRHGKCSSIEVTGGKLFNGLPTSFTAGRYHSLITEPHNMPEVLKITARSADGTVMAVEHKQLPLAAVQFHPESILTMAEDYGRRLIFNVMTEFAVKNRGA